VGNGGETITPSVALAEGKPMTAQRLLRSRLTYANLVSTLALVVALGTGTAYAANTVFSTDIVDGEVKEADLGDGAVSSAKIPVGAVSGADIADGSVGLSDLGSITTLTDISAKASPSGGCRAKTLTVPGATVGQVVALSAGGKLQSGVVLHAEQVSKPDAVRVAVCYFGKKKMKAVIDVPVRVVTLD
jgi:hypothetical protein